MEEIKTFKNYNLSEGDLSNTPTLGSDNSVTIFNINKVIKGSRLIK